MLARWIEIGARGTDPHPPFARRLLRPHFLQEREPNTPFFCPHSLGPIKHVTEMGKLRLGDPKAVKEPKATAERPNPM